MQSTSVRFRQFAIRSGLCPVALVWILATVLAGTAAGQEETLPAQAVQTQSAPDSSIRIENPGQPSNWFFQVQETSVKFAIFIAFWLLSYMIAFGIFRIFLKRNHDPLATTAWTFGVALVLIFFSAFICFSEYTLLPDARPDVNTPLFEYLKMINPLPWVLGFVLVAVLAVVNIIGARPRSG